MNSMQIKDKIRNIAENKNIDFNTILRLYMYDRFIERLSVSKYKDMFILKGGFYLSIFFGIESRSTMDIDMSIRNINFSEDNIRRVMIEIINIDIGDDSTIELVNILPIRNEDEYGGYRILLNVKVENMREKFQIDIATGDPITLTAIRYQYITILENRKIKLWAYNIETVLAEKLETILSRVEASSRLRDYYDIYLIYIRNWDSIDKTIFKEAIFNTFAKREYKGDINKTLHMIKNSEILKKRWDIYSRKNEYAKGIAYEEIMKCLEEVVSILLVVEI